MPPESMSTPQRTQVEGLDVRVAPNPLVRAYSVKIDPPSLSDLRADADRLLEALASRHGLGCDRVDLRVLQSLSPRLREWGWECRAEAAALASRVDYLELAGTPDFMRTFAEASHLGRYRLADGRRGPAG